MGNHHAQYYKVPTIWVWTARQMGRDTTPITRFTTGIGPVVINKSSPSSTKHMSAIKVDCQTRHGVRMCTAPLGFFSMSFTSPICCRAMGIFVLLYLYRFVYWICSESDYSSGHEY